MHSHTVIGPPLSSLSLSRVSVPVRLLKEYMVHSTVHHGYDKLYDHFQLVSNFSKLTLLQPLSQFILERASPSLPPNYAACAAATSELFI